MALRDWLQPPRRLIALFCLVTLVPSLALVAAGWRLLEQDRANSLRQLSERREQAADLAVSELEHVVAAAEQALRDPQALRSVATSDNDVVGVMFGTERVEAFPSGRLAFHPSTEAGTEAPAQRFAEGEDFEFRQHALAAAIQVYRGLARSPDPALRAGALIRLARTPRNTGESEKALIACPLLTDNPYQRTAVQMPPHGLERHGQPTTRHSHARLPSARRSLYGECMSRLISTTVRLDQADVQALKRARAAGHSASELVRKGLRVVASRYYPGRRPPSTRLFESTDAKLGDESELFRDLER